MTARKDQWGEVREFICNECRFEKKATADWEIDGPTKVDRHSVISQGIMWEWSGRRKVLYDVLDGRRPQLLMDIHSVSEVDRRDIDLSKIQGPAHSTDFDKVKYVYNFTGCRLGVIFGQGHIDLGYPAIVAFRRDV